MTWFNPVKIIVQRIAEDGAAVLGEFDDWAEAEAYASAQGLDRRRLEITRGASLNDRKQRAAEAARKAAEAREAEARWAAKWAAMSPAEQAAYRAAEQRVRDGAHAPYRPLGQPLGAAHSYPDDRDEPAPFYAGSSQPAQPPRPLTPYEQGAAAAVDYTTAQEAEISRLLATMSEADQASFLAGFFGEAE